MYLPSGSNRTILGLLTCCLLVISPLATSAESKNPIIGKGNIVSKRVTLNRYHGMPIAHKLRINAIRAKRSK